MNRTRRPLGGLAQIALVALISGCGSSAAAGTQSGSASNAGKAVRFAECMRHNGVSQFPDPSSGKLTIDAIANGSSIDTSAPAFTQALSACKHLEPAGFTGTKRNSQRQQAALKFAQCIRANGVADFPDPLPDQPIIDTNRIPSAGSASGMSVLKAAMQKCGSDAAAAGVTR